MILKALTFVLIVAVPGLACAQWGAELDPQGVSDDDPTPQLAPDGSYVAGQPQLAPDGSYVGTWLEATPGGQYRAGVPQLAPDGTYVGGTPQLAPDGTYVGGTPRLAPDGTYVGGIPQLAADGRYVGSPAARSPEDSSIRETPSLDGFGYGPTSRPSAGAAAFVGDGPGGVDDGFYSGGSEFVE